MSVIYYLRLCHGSVKKLLSPVLPFRKRAMGRWKSGPHVLTDKYVWIKSTQYKKKLMVNEYKQENKLRRAGLQKRLKPMSGLLIFQIKTKHTTILTPLLALSVQMNVPPLHLFNPFQNGSRAPLLLSEAYGFLHSQRQFLYKLVIRLIWGHIDSVETTES